MATATDYKIADADDPILEMSLKIDPYFCVPSGTCCPYWYIICLFSEYQNFPT